MTEQDVKAELNSGEAELVMGRVTSLSSASSEGKQALQERSLGT